ncbi:hypothetical protein PsYK624_103800 [Phanerochaete sordida]|uniref:Fungal-type protein kinase domain-containing protein n=1 Tax=Phanerochaete sordida TaxID=48140 RepID=A0A9P3LHJ8_9APHY|nr:hypothetical protein PsYK624_103800 [Phanerochaete sordida]
MRDPDVVGSVPPRDLLNELLPLDDKVLKKMPTTNKFSVILKKAHLESDMYLGICEAFKPLTPGLEWFLSTNKLGGNGVRGRPKIGCIDVEKRDPDRGHSDEDYGNHAQSSKGNTTDKKGKRKATGFVKSGCPFDWARYELGTEVKPRYEDDPFDDTDGKAPERTDVARKDRGKLYNYVREQFARSPRVCVFQLLIFGTYARILCYDKSGVLVTERFDFHEYPELLAEFLWRYSHSSRSQRGWDTTVERANAEEHNAFYDAVSTFLTTVGDIPAPVEGHDDAERSGFVCNAFDATLDQSYPTYKVSVSAPGYSTDLIIKRPFVQPYSPCGRSTKAYLAYDMKGKKLMILKDSWRTAHGTRESEAEIYQILIKHGVPNIPDVPYAEDVFDKRGDPQKSFVDSFSRREKTWKPKHHSRLRSHVHNRIVLPVAYPLWCARTSKELVQAIFDALTALKGAREAGFLHRDISVGNIMLDENGRGVLIDWDHGCRVARPIGENQESAGPPFRTGTWQFMSIRVLQNPDVRHIAEDDVESSYWVLLWVALKWFAHQQPPRPSRLFDQEGTIRDKNKSLPPVMVGGDSKYIFLLRGNAAHLGFASPPLDDLIQQVAETFYRLYSMRPTEVPEEYRDALMRCGVDSVLQLFRTALDREDWPIVLDRVAEEQYPKERPSDLAKEDAQLTTDTFGLWFTSGDGTQSFSSMPSRQQSEAESDGFLSAPTTPPETSDDELYLAGRGDAHLPATSLLHKAAAPRRRNPRRGNGPAPIYDLDDSDVDDPPSQNSSEDRTGPRPHRRRASFEELAQPPAASSSLRRKRESSEEPEPESEASSSHPDIARHAGQGASSVGRRKGKKRRT